MSASSLPAGLSSCQKFRAQCSRAATYSKQAISNNPLRTLHVALVVIGALGIILLSTGVLGTDAMNNYNENTATYIGSLAAFAVGVPLFKYIGTKVIKKALEVHNDYLFNRYNVLLQKAGGQVFHSFSYPDGSISARWKTHKLFKDNIRLIKARSPKEPTTCQKISTAVKKNPKFSIYLAVGVIIAVTMILGAAGVFGGQHFQDFCSDKNSIVGISIGYIAGVPFINKLIRECIKLHINILIKENKAKERQAQALKLNVPREHMTTVDTLDINLMEDPAITTTQTELWHIKNDLIEKNKQLDDLLNAPKPVPTEDVYKGLIGTNQKNYIKD